MFRLRVGSKVLASLAPTKTNQEESKKPFTVVVWNYPDEEREILDENTGQMLKIRFLLLDSS